MTKRDYPLQGTHLSKKGESTPIGTCHSYTSQSLVNSYHAVMHRPIQPKCFEWNILSRYGQGMG